jgi:endogenous inhibitor of DNA gyrase (YacG/DUF329 family)
MKCANCGKETPPSNRNNRPRKFCSKECGKTWHHKVAKEAAAHKRAEEGKEPWGEAFKKTKEERAKKKEELEKAIKEGWVFYRDLAEEIGITPSSVKSRAKRLGIEATMFSDGTPGRNSWKPYYSPQDSKRIKNYAKEEKKVSTKELCGHQESYRNKKPKNYQTDVYRAKNNSYRKSYHQKPENKIRRAVSVSIHGSIIKAKGRGKGGSSFKKLGYSPKQLMNHLERQFTEEMNWENYGSFWHIDHIVPQAAMPYKSMNDKNFRAVWALSNLRPLSAVENLSKGSLHEGKRYFYR